MYLLLTLSLAFVVFCLGARLVGITLPQLIATAGLIATASIALFFAVAQKYTRSGVFNWWDFAATKVLPIVKTKID